MPEAGDADSRSGSGGLMELPKSLNCYTGDEEPLRNPHEDLIRLGCVF